MRSARARSLSRVASEATGDSRDRVTGRGELGVLNSGKCGLGRRGRSSNVLAVLLLLIAPSCAPKQRVPLDLGPGEVELYVDGERSTAVPLEVELRADRDHKLFVKRQGYLPELVVLETGEVEGDAVLRPSQVRVRLAPVIGDRRIEIEEAEPVNPQP